MEVSLAQIYAYLEEQLENGDVSDIHITEPNQLWIRRRGNLAREFDLQPPDIQLFVESVLSNGLREQLKTKGDVDTSLQIGRHRLRLNVSKASRGISIVGRRITASVPSFKKLGIPQAIIQILDKSHGLVLVTGPTGAGKSTSLASFVKHINQSQQKKIITIEDPIEYVHESEKSHIIQRELGVDCVSVAQALKSALRQDPDVILIGEMRDPETISLALTAAETGHLVLATMHSSTAARAITRIIDTFSDQEQTQVRAQLAQSLSAILAQRLTFSNRTNELHALFEVLLNNTAVQNLIRDNKIFQLENVMEISKKDGMQTMSQSEKNMVSNSTSCNGL
jgi:twitching motility protein PilT